MAELTLIIEDGTGVVGANAFASLAQVSSYLDVRRGKLKAAWDGLDEQGQIAAIIDFTQLLARHIEWDGWRTYPNTQLLDFPRYGLTDPYSGAPVPQTTVPQFLIDATGEGAPWLAMNRDRRLTLDEDRRTSSSSVAGRSRSFFQTPRLELFPPSVLTIIRPYATSGADGSGVTFGRKVRVA